VANALGQIEGWQKTGSRGLLSVRVRPDGSALVLDGRYRPTRGWSLDPWQASVLLSMDAVATQSSLLRRARDAGQSVEATMAFLAACEQQRLVAHVRDRWLSLAVYDPPRWEAPAVRAHHMLEMAE
jgi:hypothetical protein